MPQFSKYFAVRDYPFTNAANQCCNLGGGSGETTVTVGTDYVVDPADLPLIIELVPDNGVTMTVTLPWPLEPPPLGGAGSYITAVDVVDIAASGATVVFISSDNPNGTGQGSTIGNASTYSFTGSFQSVTFIPETGNPNWLIT